MCGVNRKRLEAAYREAARLLGVSDPGKFDEDYGENNLPYLFNELNEVGLPGASYRIFCVFDGQETAKEIATFRPFLCCGEESTDADDVENENKIREIFRPWFEGME